MNTPIGGPDNQDRPSHPQKILDDGSLSDVQKRDYLEDWRLDLMEQQTATAENMGADTPAHGDDVAERLRQVTDALETLKSGG